MPKFTVHLERPATDYLVAEIEIEAESAAAAEAQIEAMLAEGDEALYDLDFRFDQCGESGDIEIAWIESPDGDHVPRPRERSDDDALEWNIGGRKFIWRGPGKAVAIIGLTGSMFTPETFDTRAAAQAAIEAFVGAVVTP